MQFIDLKHQQHLIKENLNHRIHPPFDHGNDIIGPGVREPEDRPVAHTSVKHAASCPYGPLLAISTSPVTFMSTTRNINLTKTPPVFADIDRKKFEAAMGKRTFAEDPPEGNHLKRLERPRPSFADNYPASFLLQTVLNPYCSVLKQKLCGSN